MDDFQGFKSCVACAGRPATAGGRYARRVGVGLPSGKLTTWRMLAPTHCMKCQEPMHGPPTMGVVYCSDASADFGFRPRRRPRRQDARRPVAQSGDAVGGDLRRGSGERYQTTSKAVGTQQRGKGKGRFSRKGPDGPVVAQKTIPNGW